MDLLIEIAEWLLAGAVAIVILGVVVFVALALRLKHPPRD